MTPLLLSLLLGACVGSFLNVCLYRWKTGGQVVTPASFCPHCKENISWYDNIPIFSFVLLRGRCRSCRRSISRQYPLVEFSTAVLFGMNVLFKPFLGWAQLICGFCYLSFLVLLVSSDLKWRLLPHPFTDLFFVSGLLFSTLESRAPRESLFRAANGFVAVGALLFILTLIFSKGFGGGDIKMAAASTVWIGFSKAVWMLVIAFGTGALVGLILLATGRANRKSMVPFGPFLGLGSLCAWFLTELNLTMGFLR